MVSTRNAMKALGAGLENDRAAEDIVEGIGVCLLCNSWLKP